MSMVSQAMQSRGRAQAPHNFWLNAQDGTLRASEPCSGWSVVHDLAALSEGNLSRPGKRRLARHLARCHACKAILASLVNDAHTEPSVGDRAWLEEALSSESTSESANDNAAEPPRTTAEHAVATPPTERSQPAAAHAARRKPPAACYLHLGDIEPLSSFGPHVVLLVAADPAETSALALGQECAAIRRELECTPGGHAFRVESRGATTTADLRRHLRELGPTIVHFSGHGGNGVTLRDHGQLQPVPAPTLAALISASPRTRMVVLNACHTTAYADALRRVVDCVVGIPGEIAVDDARAFTAGLYRALGKRWCTSRAVEQAVATLNARRRSELHVPICWTRDEGGAAQLTLPHLDSQPSLRRRARAVMPYSRHGDRADTTSTDGA